MRSTSEIQRALDLCDGKIPEAAKFLGISYSTLFEHIKKRDLKFKFQGKVADEDLICSTYSKLQNVTKVAEKLGYTRVGVRNILRRNKIQIIQPKRYTFDQRFFTREDEAVYYWAGFLAADGCLIGNRLALDLASKDIDHLEKFKADISSNHMIRTKVNGKYSSSSIFVNSKFLREDLSRFNITRRKTLIYTFPEWLIEHPMCHHFMRGYFDGDGCWWVDFTRKTPKVTFSVAGTKEFLNVWNSILELNSLVKTPNKKIKDKGAIGELVYSGNGYSRKIRDFLYKDANIFLQRKYDIAHKFL